MKKTLHRLTAFVIAAVLVISESAIPVYAEETDHQEDIIVTTPEESLEEKIPENDPVAGEEVTGDLENSEEGIQNETHDGDEENVETEVENQEDENLEDELEGMDDFEFVPGYVPAPHEDEYESPYEDYDGDSLLGMESKYISSVATSIPSRSQNPYGTCWAHATMSATEMSAVKNGIRMRSGSTANSSIDLSELHLAYFAGNGLEVYDPLGGLAGDYNGVPETENFMDNGGSADNAAHLLTSWIGAADETSYPYNNNSNNKVLLTYSTDRTNAVDDVLHVRNYYTANPKTDRDAVKKLVKDYGCVTVSYYALQSGYTYTIGGKEYSFDKVFNLTHNCYYLPENVRTNHAVSIVGWDDNFPKDNFVSTPDGDGAWLIRNSWQKGNKIDSNGDIIGSQGSYLSYFWMSYYDGSISDSCYAFVMDPIDRYDHNYQYDGCMTGAEITGPTRFANIFTAGSGSQTLKAVYFSTHSANVDYTVDVYTGITGSNPTNGTHAVNSQTGRTVYAGGHTIDLDTPVDLVAGEKFSVIISVSDDVGMDAEYGFDSGYITTAYTESGRSLYSYGGSRWYDQDTGDFRIKAFTTDDDSTRYTITYDANGGFFSTGDSTQIKSIKEGQTYGTMPEPTKDGYTFEGWYTAASGGSEVASDSTVSGDKTLYAHWTVNTYTLTLNANGGSFGTDGSTRTINVTYDQPYGTLPTPTKEGYDFVGWYDTSSSSGGTEVLPETIYQQAGNSTIYARWTEAKYTVTLIPNGGTCYASEIEVTYNSYYSSLPSPTRTGYSFLGWYTAESGGSKVTSSTRVTETSDHTLYARWSGASVTVKFDRNDGSGSFYTRILEYGGTYLGTSTSLPSPKRSGYSLIGWFTGQNDGTQINEETTVTNAAAHTVYAHWKPLSNTVTFDANGGTCDPTYKSVTYASTYGELPTPTRTGYDFTGWYTSLTGGTKITAASVVSITTAQTLYAHWDAASYMVTFNSNGGTCGTTSKSVIYASTYGALPTPTKAGYDFAGWYTSLTGGTKITSSTNVAITAAQTLYAHWTALSYTVTFNANGGTCDTPSKSVTYASTYGELPTPARAGYDFAGWYTLASGGTQITAASDVEITSAQILYAHWTGKQYKVTFDGNGGTVTGSAEIYVTSDGTYGTLPGADRTGYRFAGWYTAANGGTVVHKNTYTITANDHTLYAHWTAESITVTFDANGGSCTPSSVTVTYDETYGTLPTASRPGYSHDGWYTAANNGEKVENTTKVTNASAHTLYAHWNAASYTVTFDANGGTCDPTIKHVTYASTYGELPTPARAGYDFAGWYTLASGGTQITAASDVEITSAQTLYAHWTGTSFTVTFDPNGGQISGSSTRTVIYGGTYGELAGAFKTGYSLEGWYTQASGGTKITPETTVDIPADQTLYAHWTYGNYTLTLNANGGLFSPGITTHTKTITYGQSYGELTSPERTGYTFDGWYTSQAGGEQIMSDMVVSVTSDQSLYAHWTIKKYTVRFDENYEGGRVYSRELDYNAKIGYPPTASQRDLYKSTGWFTGRNDGTKIDQNTVVNGDVTYYAHWIKIPTYNVNFNENYPGAAVTSGEYRHNSPLGELPAAPVRDGYSFTGWFTAAKGGKAVTTSTVVSANTTYYAQWKPGQYKLTYNANGGICNTAGKTVTFDAKYSTLPTPKRDGYKFDGWYDSESGGTLITSASVVSKGEDHSIWAHWIPNRYLLVFDPTGGICNTDSRTVTFEKTYGYLPDGTLGDLPTPTKAGYDFDGWYIYEFGSEKITKDTIVLRAITHTVSAQWKAKKYTVTFDVNDDASNPATLTGDATMDVDYAAKYGVLPTVTRPQHAFLGWYTKKEGGVKVTQNSTVSTSRDHTLFAHWEDWGEVLDEEGKQDRADKAVESIADDSIWVRGIPESTPYTSTAIKYDDLRVYRGNRLLTKDKDYSLSYRTNINAGTAIVTITGKGNYSGKREERFVITPLDLGSVTQSGRAYANDISLVENGRIQKGTTIVYYTFSNGKTITLRSGSDYYYDAADAYTGVLASSGDYTVTVTGKGNYTGKLTFTEHVLAKDNSSYMIGKAAIKSIPAQQATGNPIEFAGDRSGLLEVSMGSGKNKQVLSQETDYDVSYQNNVLPGTATVVVRGKGAYYGTKTATFRINATQISKTVAALSGLNPSTNSTAYTGAQIRPELVLTYAEKKGDQAQTLTRWSTDNTTGSYTVDGYTNNIDAGKNRATVTYSGKGAFTGTLKKTFTIDQVSLAAQNEGDATGNVSVRIEAPSVPFQKGGTKPKVEAVFHGKDATGADKDYVLTEGKDYTVTYKNNTVVNTTLADPKKIPTVTVTGKGNFKDKREITFAISGSDLSDTEMSADDVVYKKKVGNFVTRVVVTDTNGKNLAAGTDYDKNIEYYYDEIPDGTNVLNKNGGIVNVSPGDIADVKNHIVPAGTIMRARINNNGKGVYNGSNEATFRVVSIGIASVAVKIKDQIYTGRRIDIGYDDIVSIKSGKYSLFPGDYEIENSFVNINKGTGKVILKGLGNYGGTKTVTFRIVDRSLINKQ